MERIRPAAGQATKEQTAMDDLQLVDVYSFQVRKYDCEKRILRDMASGGRIIHQLYTDNRNRLVKDELDNYHSEGYIIDSLHRRYRRDKTLRYSRLTEFEPGTPWAKKITITLCDRYEKLISEHIFECDFETKQCNLTVNKYDRQEQLLYSSTRPIAKKKISNPNLIKPVFPLQNITTAERYF